MEYLVHLVIWVVTYKEVKRLMDEIEKRERDTVILSVAIIFMIIYLFWSFNNLLLTTAERVHPYSSNNISKYIYWSIRNKVHNYNLSAPNYNNNFKEMQEHCIFITF